MAGSGGNLAGSGGGMASNATGCDAYCARSLEECTSDDVEDCLASCERDEELCPSQSADWLECLLPRPDSDFRCLMGITTPNEDVCDTESTELQRCMFFGP
jgi:hypothetical protein